MAVSEANGFNLTASDKLVLSQSDGEFTPHDWAELNGIIGANNLSALKRRPSDLRRYMVWTAQAQAAYGSVTNYLLEHRLPKAWGRPPYIAAAAAPFADPSDYRVLLNEWPYGLAAGITHLVVWTRTLIPIDPQTGDLTPGSRAAVDRFIEQYFVDALGPGGHDRVLWFKNWGQLQSVRQLEHVHVLVRDVPAKVLEAWTAELPCHRAVGKPASATPVMVGGTEKF